MDLEDVRHRYGHRWEIGRIGEEYAARLRTNPPLPEYDDQRAFWERRQPQLRVSATSVDALAAQLAEQDRTWRAWALWF